MKCTKCKGVLRMTNTYSAGDFARTHKAICEKCGTTHVLHTFIAQVDPTPGNGAYALATKLKNPPNTRSDGLPVES